MSQKRTRRGIVAVSLVLVVSLATVAPVAAAGLTSSTDTDPGEALNSSDGSTTDAKETNETATSDSDGENTDSDNDTSSSGEADSPSSNDSNSTESEAAGSPESNETDTSGSDNGQSTDTGSADADGANSSESNESDTHRWSNWSSDSMGSGNESTEPTGGTVGKFAISEMADTYGLENSTVGAATEGLTEGNAPGGGGDETGVENANGAVNAVGSAVKEVVTLSGADELLVGPIAASDASPKTVGPAGADQPSAGEATSATNDESGGLFGVGPTSGMGTDVPMPAGAAFGVGAVAAAAVARSGILSGMTSFGATLAGALVPVSTRSSALLDRLTRLFIPLRYSRYDDSDPLDHEAREAVFGVVKERPGAYLSEVAKRAGLPLSTTRHHIRVLEREDLVSGAKVRGKRRFYPANTSGIELTAALNDEATAAVLDAIARLSGASVSDLANNLGRDPSTISYHLQRLADDDIIVREREGRSVMNRLAPEIRSALEPEAGIEKPHVEEAVAGRAD